MVQLRRVRDLNVVGLDGQPAFVSGASGLVRAGAFFHVISDDALCLASFRVEGLLAGTLTRIADGELPLEAADRKSRKPDFEVLLALPPTAENRFGSLLALGSGSRPNRRRGVRIELSDRGQPIAQEGLDLAPLFAAFDGTFTETNIEGAVIIGSDLLLFQRGNAGSPVNAILALPWEEAFAAIDAGTAVPRPAIREVDLGVIDGVPLAFTDATLAGGKILFSAVAERTANAYDDGEVAGSAIGLLDRDGRVERLSRLSPAAKIEGIEAQLVDGRLQIALVDDADDPSRPSQLFAATMTIKEQER
jgi:hypothetical protein